MRFRSIAAAVAALIGLASCTWTQPPTPPHVFKIGLVTDARGLSDQGFNQLANMGLQRAITDLHVKGQALESHAVGDYATNLAQLGNLNYDLVIAVSSTTDTSMQEAVATVAPEFQGRPGGGGGGETAVNFAVIEAAGVDAKLAGLKLPNVEILDFKGQDAGALVGVIAALLEKDGKGPANTSVVGAVGGMDIPSVNQFIAGFKWAVQMEDSRVKVVTAYANDFTDPAKCAAAAQSEVNQKAEILFEVADKCGGGVLQSAVQDKVYSIGSGVDQKDANPSVIASAVLNVDVAAYAAIKGIVNGNFTAATVTYGVANNGVGYDVDNLAGGLPADIKTELDSMTAKITSGTLTPPATIS